MYVFSKLFDAQVQPIALYGAEIWGIGKPSRLIEKLHLFAMKKLLGVGMRTPNDLLSTELGRYTIYITAHIRRVRYWLKLTRMDVNRLPFKAYNIQDTGYFIISFLRNLNMLCDLDQKGKTNWVSNVRH